MTLGMFNRIKKKNQQSQSQQQPALPDVPTRASYTLTPPLVDPWTNNDKPEDYYDGGIGPYSSFGEGLPPQPEPTTKKPCGCQVGKK